MTSIFELINSTFSKEHQNIGSGMYYIHSFLVIHSYVLHTGYFDSSSILTKNLQSKTNYLN